MIKHISRHVFPNSLKCVYKSHSTSLNRGQTEGENGFVFCLRMETGESGSQSLFTSTVEHCKLQIGTLILIVFELYLFRFFINQCSKP